MTALAVALVMVAFMAAVAYAAPKFYWYRMQGKMIVLQAADEKERFAALKESHDLGAIVTPPTGPIGLSETTDIPPGQYL